MSLRPSLKTLTLTLLLLSTLSLPTPPEAAAQLPETKKESEEEKAKARKELERKALLLLEETLQGAQTLKLGENRAALRAQAADLLWTRDEKRARSLFREALADVVAAQSAEGAMRERGWMLMNQRTQLLYAAAARDAQFALELLRESRPSSEAGSGSAVNDADQELRMEQSLTAIAADSDPKAALRMAEESLSKGVTFGALGVLERLRRKDSESATKLAVQIIAKLRSDGITAKPESTMVAVSLLRMVLSPQSAELYYYGGAPPAQGRAAEKSKPLVLGDSDARDLADLVSGAALKESPAAGGLGLLMQLRPMLAELEKRVPARAAQLRQRMADMEKSLDPRMKAWWQLDSLGSKSADAMLEDAAKAPSEVRGQFYSSAAMKLLQSGDAERARQVINENMRGQEREQMLAIIDHTEVARAVEKGDTETAKAVVSRIKSKERRAAALAELAVAFASKGDKKGAAQLLEEARGLVARQPDNEKEVEAFMEVARAYALVDPAKTFEMLDPLIDQANDMLTAAALLEKFGAGGGMFRKGEMILTPALDAAGGAYARHLKALSELARVDFERTKIAADRFNRDEARLAARLVVARSVLSDKLDAGGADFRSRFVTAGVVGADIVVSH